MKTQLKNGAVEILLEGDETAHAILAAVAMAAFALYGGGGGPLGLKELPVSEALQLPRIQQNSTGVEHWTLQPCTLYARAMFVTGWGTGNRVVTVTFPRHLSDPLFVIFIAGLERALERIRAQQ